MYDDENATNLGSLGIIINNEIVCMCCVWD